MRSHSQKGRSAIYGRQWPTSLLLPLLLPGVGSVWTCGDPQAERLSERFQRCDNLAMSLS